MSNTLTITFPTTSPTPVNGYEIQYWPANDGSNVTTVIAYTSPFVISGLSEYQYYGIVTALCRGSFRSNGIEFATNPVCELTYTLTDFRLPDNTEGTNGIITVVPHGGSGDYSIVWAATGTTDFSATDLQIGTNLFTLLDNITGCHITGTVPMSHTTFVCPLVLSIEQTSPTNSIGTNGTATVTVGDLPGGDVTYLWSNGQTTPTATGLHTGLIYTCTVTWIFSGVENHCVSYISTSPIASSTFTCNLSASFTTTDSYISSATGTAIISVSGGTGPYTYLWSNGQTTLTATGLMGGVTYTCLVVDTAPTVVACSKLFSVTIPTITCHLDADGGGSVTAPNNVAGNNGTATMPVIIHGVAPIRYLWNTVPAQTTQTATGLLENTTYTCVATDAAGCTKSIDFEIPSGTCTESACRVSCCTYLLENTGQDTTFTYYDCEGTFHDREIGIDSLSATICANKDYGDIVPYESTRWWTLTLLGCCISHCMSFTLYPDTFPYQATMFRYKACYSDDITVVTLNAGDSPITICVNMSYGIRKVMGNGYYVMGDNCILEEGGVVVEHIYNSHSLIINQITGIYGFTVINPITFGNTYTGSHPFGLTSGSISINTSNVSAGDIVSMYKNGDPLIVEQPLVNGINMFTGITYDPTDNLFFIFENNL